MSAQPASLIALAFDQRVETPTDAISERILDSALALAAASGIRNLTVDDVAARARAGRMTVYRRFGDRAGLIEALSLRECRRCLADLNASVDPAAPAEEQIVDGFAAALRISREHPLLNRLARVEPEAVLEAVTADDGAIFALLREFFAERIREGQRGGQLGPVDPSHASELLVRLGVSFVLIQETVLPLEDERGARAMARELIVPMLAA